MNEEQWRNEYASLDSQPTQSPVSTTPVVASKPKRGMLFVWAWAAIALLVAGTAVLVIILLHQKVGRNSETNKGNGVKVQDIDTASLGAPADQLNLSNSSKVVVNGQLQSNQGVVISPTSQPSTGSAGQLYVDQSTKELRYYNGQSFVSLATTNDLQRITANTSVGIGGVTSLQGQTGVLSLLGNNGLTVGGAGNNINLSLPQNLTNAGIPTFSGLNLSNTSANGVLVTDGGNSVKSVNASSNNLCLVSSTLGPTFASCASGSVGSLNGLTGTLTVQGTTNQITVTDNGSNTITLSTPQNLHIGASPIFAAVNTNTITPSGAMTLGSVSQGFTLQGNATSTISANSGGFATLLGFASPTANHTITFGNETGTVCTTAGSAACTSVYAPVSGSSAYIQFAPASAQVDNTCTGNPSCTTSTIYVAKSTTYGNILRLQGWCTDPVGCPTPQLQDALVLQGDGQMYFRSLQSSATAFQIRDATNNPVVSISTQASTNLITNPSFESAISPWVAFGCTTTCNGGGVVPPTVSLYSTAAYDGVNSLQIQNTSGAAQNKQGVYFPVNLDANTTYAVSFVASEVDTVKIGTVRAGYYVNSTPETQGTNLKACGTVMQIITRVTDDPASPNWSTFTCTFTTSSAGPGGIGGSGIYITNGTASSSYIIDKVIVQKGTSTNSYNGQFNIFTPNTIQVDNESAFLVTGALGRSLNVDTVTSDLTIGLHTYTDSDGNTQFGAFKVQDASGNTFIKATTGNAGSLSDWTKNANQLNTSVSNSQPAIVSYGTQNYAYTVGGSTGSGPTNAVQRASINTNGTGTWATDSNAFPYVIKNHGVVSYRNYIYVLGGDDGTTWHNEVYMNQIKSDGSLNSSWAYAGLNNLSGSGGSHLLTAHSGIQAFVYNGYIYVIGGRTSSLSNSTVGTIEYAQIRGDGTLGSWTSVGAGKSLADLGSGFVRRDYAVALHNNTVFVIGGNSSSGAQSTVLFNTIGSNGDFTGSWQSTTAMPTTRTNMAADFYGDYLYVFGGSGASKTPNSYAFTRFDVSSGGVGDWALSNIYDGTTAQNLMSVQNHGLVRIPSTNTFFLVTTSSGSAASKNIVYVSAKDSSNALDVNGSLSVSSGGTFGGGLNVITSTDTTGALIVNNSNNKEVFKVDTVNSAITLGGLNSPDFNNWINTGIINNGGTTPYGIEGNTSVVVNGYIYSISGTHGGSGTALVNYAKLNTDGSINDNGWTATTVLPDYKVGAAAISSNGYIYVLGGVDSGGVSNKVYVGHPNPDGTISSWKTLTSTPLNTAVMNPGIAVYNGYLYIMGGATSYTPGSPPAPGTATNIVQYAQIKADGTLTSFAPVTSSLNISSVAANRKGGRGAVANGYIYFTGGSDGTGAQNTVFYARPNSTTGDISSWSTTSASLTDKRAYHTSIVSNGYLYVVAGTNTTFEASDTNTVQYGKITANGDITSWSTGASTLFGATSNHGSAFANGFLYLVGGHNDLAAVQFASSARVSVGGALDLVGVGSQTLTDAGGGGQLTAGNTTVVGTLDVRDNATFTQSISVGNNFSAHGQVLLQNTTDSTAALSVQNASGSNIFSIDTTNGQAVLGQSSTTDGALTFNQSNSAFTGTLKLSGTALTQNETYRLPTTGGTICVLEASNCVGAGGGVTTAGGTDGKLVKFTGTTTVGDSILSESGTTITNSGSLVVQGTNGITIGNPAGMTGILSFKNATNSNTVSLQSGVTTSDVTFTLPTADGTANQCLQTNGSGVLGFANCVGGSGGASGVVSIQGASGGSALAGTLTLNNASGSGTTLTIDNATTSAKGIASFSSTNFSVSSGAVNTIQDINTGATPQFAGVLANSLDRATSGTLTVGTSTATAITIGSSSINATVAGGLDVNGTASFGNGVLALPASTVGLLLRHTYTANCSSNCYGQLIQNTWSVTSGNQLYGLRVDNALDTTGANALIGIYVNPFTLTSGSVTTATGIQIKSQTIGTNNFGILVDSSASGAVWLGGNTSSCAGVECGIIFGSQKDTNLYRGAAATLQSDATQFKFTGAASLSSGATTAGSNFTITAGVGSGSTAGGILSLNSGSGGILTGTGDGGAVQLYAGSGGALSGNGGAVQINSGAGTGTAGQGGAIQLQAGNGVGGSAGGSFTFMSGNAGSGSGATSTGGDVTFTLQAGGTGTSGGSAGGRGGNFSVTAGNGGSGNAAGGAISFTSGNGSGTQSGGTITLQGGTGANNASSTGGVINITGGTGGTNGSTTGRAGGAVTISGGAGGNGTSTNGTGGLLTLQGGAAGSGAGGNGTGGGLTLQSGAGRGTGSGGTLQITGGAAGSTGTGGAITITSGTGGSTSGSSGDIQIKTANPSNGGSGNVLVQSGGGVLQTANTGTLILQTGDHVSTTGSSGNVTLKSGDNSSSSGSSGSVTIQSGDLTSNSTGGVVAIKGGTNSGIGNGGSVSINAGSSSGGTNGSITIGNTVVASSITIGQTTGAATVALQSGSGAVAIQTTTGDINIGTLANARNVSVATGAANQTVVIGSTSGSSSLTLDSGTGTINIGNSASARTVNLATGAAAQTLVLGSTTSTSSATLQSGSGQINIQSTSGAINIGTNNSVAITIGKSGGSGTLTVNGATTINGHIVVGNTTGTTTFAANTAVCGTGCTASISGSDVAGSITINTGTGVTTGTLGTVTFSLGWSAPKVVISPGNFTGATYPQYFGVFPTSSTLDLRSNNAISDSSSYVFYYHVIDAP